MNYYEFEKPDDDRVAEFKADVVRLMKKHALSISHEDHHGAFIIERFDDGNVKWFLDAFDKATDQPKP